MDPILDNKAENFKWKAQGESSRTPTHDRFGVSFADLSSCVMYPSSFVGLGFFSPAGGESHPSQLRGPQTRLRLISRFSPWPPVIRTPVLRADLCGRLGDPRKSPPSTALSSPAVCPAGGGRTGLPKPSAACRPLRARHALPRFPLCTRHCGARLQAARSAVTGTASLFSVPRDSLSIGV